MNIEKTRQPVEYRVKEKSLIGNDLHEAGATVFYAGLPSANLEPLCDEGRARAKEFAESDAQRVAQMIAMNKESAVGDPSKFMEQFAKVMAEQIAEQQAERHAHAVQMAKMMEMQQTASLQLAQAAHNMATLAAALTAAPAAPATPAAPPEPTAAPTGDAGDTGKETGEVAPAKRTRS